MGLLCKDPDSRPASPDQAAEDLLGIEDEFRGSFTGAVSHFSSIVDEVTKSINDLGLDPLKVMPSRNPRTIHGDSLTVLETAQKRLSALGQVYSELEKDIKSARSMYKRIEKCLENGSASVEPTTKKLEFHRNEVALEFDNIMDNSFHLLPRYPLRATPPPFMRDVADSGFGQIQFFDDMDVLRWEEQEAVFGEFSPAEDDDDEDYDDQSFYGHGWGASPGPISEDGENTHDDIDETIINFYCYLCNCQVPHDNVSRLTHINGRRHRETKEANAQFIASFKSEAEAMMIVHQSLRSFIPTLDLRIEVPDTRPFRQMRNRGGGRGNRAPRHDLNHGGQGLSGNRRRGGGGHRNPGQQRRGHRLPQENQDVTGQVFPNLSWPPYSDWAPEQRGFGW